MTLRDSSGTAPEYLWKDSKDSKDQTIEVTDRGNSVFDISFADWKTQCSDLTAAQIVGS